MTTVDGGIPADPIQAPGTPENRWRQWPRLAALPTRSLHRVRSALVLAAHPDDETLGVGGILAMLAASGARLRVVVATDGEGSHPHSTVTNPGQLAERRRAEDVASLRRLGVDASAVHRLGLPDSGVAGQEDGLTAELTGMIRGFDVCLAPWFGDYHPDHEAAGRAAAAAGARHAIPVLHYPVWLWHWAEPGDDRVPWQLATRTELPEFAVTAKREAIACHTSQIEPLGPGPGDAAVLAPEDLAHFHRPYEVLFA